jgi:ferredoxin
LPHAVGVAHRTIKSAYQQLTERLNRFPLGAPPTPLLYRILEMLFSEREAALVSQLPVKPFTVQKAARLWKTGAAEAEKILHELASRAILLDIEQHGETLYLLPPPMAGFFEFAMMRVRGDLNQQVLAELFHQYISVEEDFIKALVGVGETQFGRVFVNEPALSAENALHVLDYERASEAIKTASDIGIGLCFCRHKMEHLGRDCDAPKNTCMTLNTSAASLIRHGHARRAETAEALAVLDEARGRNLVQFAENVREGVNFICHCCGCCCEAMQAARRFGLLQPVHTTNFLPRVDEIACSGCGKCVRVCPVEAMTLVSAHNPQKPQQQRAKLNAEICLGCGVCKPVCPSKALTLESRPERVITPVNSTHRVVLMAIERGGLQDLIFDNQALLSHRAMAAILGVILKLPPIKQAMASRQMKSRYLERLLAGAKV